MSILTEIFTNKRQEVAEARAILTEGALERLAMATPRPLDFRMALREPSLPAPRLIGEIKKQSPSKGILRADLNVDDIAQKYAANGVAAISVLTDKKYFGGSVETLQRIARLNLELPLLRKDFIFHPYQLLEARAYGASAALLIVAMLAENTLRELIDTALDLRLTPLIEVHTREELDIAVRNQGSVLGINNRNLHNFEVRLETTLELCQGLPAGVTVVAESGIHSREDVNRLAEAGIHAMLVGESLMTAEDIAGKVRELTQTERVISE